MQILHGIVHVSADSLFKQSTDGGEREDDRRAGKRFDC